MDNYDDEFLANGEEEQVPFETVLEELFTGESVPIHHLYRLSDMTPADFDQFTREWNSVAEERRKVMVQHMADLVEDNYIVDFAPVFAFMFADESPDVRLAALEGVWDATDPRLIDPIIRLLESDNVVPVQAAAARALAHYILLSEWGQINRDHTTQAVSALLAAYESADTATEVRRAALEAVAASGHSAVTQHIREAYESDSPDFQLSALFAMGNTADQRWLPVLLQEMSNPDPDMRAEAARAAGSIGGIDAVSQLIELCSDEDREVAEAAVLALGQIGGEQAYEFLSELAEDDQFAELHDAADVALEEMEWALGDFDLLSFDGGDLEDLDEDEDEDDGLGVN